MTGAGTKYAAFPPIYGTLKTDPKKEFFGEDAWKNRTNLNLTFPVKDGYIRDWDHMDEMLSYCFDKQLGGVDPSKHRVLIVDGHPIVNNKYREKMAEMMFEKFNVPKFQMFLQGPLVLMGQGLLTGLALCTGHSYSKATPVYESLPMTESIRHNKVAGRVVNMYYEQLIKAEGKIKPEGGDQWPLTLEDMKEKMIEYQPKGAVMKEKSFKMPDGKEIKVGAPNYRAADVMFDPSLVEGADETEGLYDKSLLAHNEVIAGIHELAIQSIRSCDCDQFELLDKIVLYGGNSLIPNMPAEIERRMSAMYPKKRDCVEVRAPDDRLLAGVQGGAIITGVGSFDRQWVTRDVYDDLGPEDVVRRFN